MPTVFIIMGFRFFFYSNENNEPMHVHITKGNGYGKVWIEDEIIPAYLNKFTVSEQNNIMKIIEDEIVTLRKKWNEYFGK